VNKLPGLAPFVLEKVVKMNKILKSFSHTMEQKILCKESFCKK